MAAEQTVSCGTHGRRQKAYVCRHVARGTGLGFNTPADEQRHGWCDRCDDFQRQCGGWTDASEAFAGIVLICDLCFEAARERNQ